MGIDTQTFLEHYGVKGMQWGVRKQRDTPSVSSLKRKELNKENPEHKAELERRNKRAKVILGSAGAAVAIAGGAYFLKKHLGVKTRDISKPSDAAKKFTQALADEPVAIVHSSRGRNRGYQFLQGGSMKSPEEEFVKAGLHEADVGFFKRYGDNNEKIAARFADPQGRKDFSGRLIGHDVVIPKEMSEGIRNIDDVVKLTWPKLQPLFDSFFESEQGTYGPGF